MITYSGRRRPITEVSILITAAYFVVLWNGSYNGTANRFGGRPQPVEREPAVCLRPARIGRPLPGRAQGALFAGTDAFAGSRPLPGHAPGRRHADDRIALAYQFAAASGTIKGYYTETWIFTTEPAAGS